MGEIFTVISLYVHVWHFLVLFAQIIRGQIYDIEYTYGTDNSEVFTDYLSHMSRQVISGPSANCAFQ